MEGNENILSTVDESSLKNNFDSDDVANNIINDILSIDIEIKIDNDALHEENVLQQFESNELPIVETIDLTNDPVDEHEEQVIEPDNCIPIINSVLEGEFLMKCLRNSSRILK